MAPAGRIIHVLGPRERLQEMPWSSCLDAGQGDGKAVTSRLPQHPCAVAMKAEAMIAWLHPAPSRTVATSVGPCWRPVPFYPGTDLRAERLSHHLQQLEPGLIEILLELSARYRDPVHDQSSMKQTGFAMLSDRSLLSSCFGWLGSLIRIVCSTTDRSARSPGRPHIRGKVLSRLLAIRFARQPAARRSE